MKKLVLPALMVFLVGLSGAATIQSENVTVDLESSEVEVDLRVTEQTSDSFSYTTSYLANDVQAEINGEPRECEVEQLQIGTTIRCPVEKKGNLTSSLKFTGRDITDSRNGVKVFTFRKTFSRLTDSFNMDVILPQGTGIIDRKNISTPVVLPQDYDIGSTGRRISVSWRKNPGLGDSMEFRIMYEELSEPQTANYSKYILYGFGSLLMLLVGYIIWRRANLSDLSSVYDELSEDEIELLELLKQEDGELLQKDAVDKSEYSKAKISEVVSSLEEKEIIVKEKEGRSNKLKISKDFKY